MWQLERKSTNQSRAFVISVIYNQKSILHTWRVEHVVYGGYKITCGLQSLSPS